MPFKSLETLTKYEAKKLPMNTQCSVDNKSFLQPTTADLAV